MFFKKVKRNLHMRQSAAGMVGNIAAYNTLLWFMKGIINLCEFEKFKRKALLAAIKLRAKNKGIPFNLSWTDIVPPEYCPVLGIKLKYGDGRIKESTPSVDRIIPNKGYVRGNIVIVSQRANRLKNDASLKELELLYKFYKALCQSVADEE